MNREELLKIAKPILFNTEMVRAILEGRKTVTRRLPSSRVRDKWFDYEEYVGMVAIPGSVSLREEEFYKEYPPFKKGDYLYVRETFSPVRIKTRRYLYKVGCEEANNLPIKWRPSIHMPKEAARIFLKVTDVRMERLQDIMKAPPGPHNQVVREGCTYGCDFIAVWESTIKKSDLDKYGWEANPWVWVIEFERVEV